MELHFAYSSMFVVLGQNKLPCKPDNIEHLIGW